MTDEDLMARIKFVVDNSGIPKYPKSWSKNEN